MLCAQGSLCQLSQPIMLTDKSPLTENLAALRHLGGGERSKSKLSSVPTPETDLGDKRSISLRFLLLFEGPELSTRFSLVTKKNLSRKFLGAVASHHALIWPLTPLDHHTWNSSASFGSANLRAKVVF